jgi:hypothetical protein
MSKRPGFKLPENRVAVVDSWVEQGKAPAPEQTLRAPADLPLAMAPGPAAPATARLTIDLPKDLHRRFKRACLDHETKMVAEVVRFIEDWTQKHS